MRNTLFGASLLSSSLLVALGLVACGDETVSPLDDDGESATTSASTGAGGMPGTGGSGGGEVDYESEIQTISGDITWTVTFDDTAKAGGATDCSYTRHYEGVEDASAKWLCPSCEIMFRAEVEMTAGEADCYAQISSSAYAKSEWIGYGNGTWYRGLGGPMTEQGTVTMDAGGLTTANTVTDLEHSAGGFFSFDVAGAFTTATTIADVMNGYRPPSTYACGWPKASLPEYTGDYTIQVGQTVPDGLFKDGCEETVRLHDLLGTYAIIDMAAADCPPCRAMAEDEEAFIADMAQSGIEVRVITLLAPSLSDPLGTTSTAKINNWVSTFELSSPVVGDRGWGLSMFIPAIGEDLGYPSWVLVGPNLEVLEFGTGYGGFAEHKAAILAHAQ